MRSTTPCGAVLAIALFAGAALGQCTGVPTYSSAAYSFMSGLPAGASGPVLDVLETADFDNDGQVDIVVGVELNSPGLRILRNQGGGTFVIQPPIPCSHSLSDLTVGDFDSDGRTDVAVCGTAVSVTPAGNVMQGRLSIYLNQTGFNGQVVTFAQPLVFAFGPIGVMASTGRAIRVCDLNGDGILDAAISDDLSHNVWILPGQGAFGLGDGSFGPATAYPTAPAPFDLALADFNHDGATDVAALGASTITLLAGTFGPSGLPAGSFTQIAILPVASFQWANLVAADLDHDGIPDLATSNAVTVSIGHGNGDFTFAFSVHPGGGDSWKLVAGDFSGDGRMDLAATQDAAGDLSFLLGNAGGSWTSFTAAFPFQSFMESIKAADFDGDGKLDFAIAWAFNGVRVLLSTCPPPAPIPLVGVLSPNGGEVLDVGSFAQLDWFKSSTTAAVDLDVSRDGGASWQRIAAGLTGTGFSWQVTAPGTGSARFRVSASGLPSISDQSDWTFTIAGPGQASSSVIGAGCSSSGSPPTLFAGLPILVHQVPIAIVGGPPSALGALFASAVPGSATPIGPGCLVYLDPGALGLVAEFTTTSSGTWNAAYTVPDENALVGVSLRIQAVMVSSTFPGYVLTNAVELGCGF